MMKRKHVHAVYTSLNSNHVISFDGTLTWIKRPTGSGFETETTKTFKPKDLDNFMGIDNRYRFSHYEFSPEDYYRLDNRDALLIWLSRSETREVLLRDHRIKLAEDVADEDFPVLGLKYDTVA